MDSSSDRERQFLRHTVATVAYRANKALKGAPAEFGSYRAGGESSRTPLAILGHMGDLFDWALSLARGEKAWKETPPREWEEEAGRFFAAVEGLDAFLSSDAPLCISAEKLFQGPIADALSHTGQIAYLRRLAGTPIRGENYVKASIEAGRAGPVQLPPKFEFD